MDSAVSRIVMVVPSGGMAGKAWAAVLPELTKPSPVLRELDKLLAQG